MRLMNPTVRLSKTQSALICTTTGAFCTPTGFNSSALPSFTYVTKEEPQLEVPHIFPTEKKNHLPLSEKTARTVFLHLFKNVEMSYFTRRRVSSPKIRKIFYRFRGCIKQNSVCEVINYSTTPSLLPVLANKTNKRLAPNTHAYIADSSRLA